MSYEFGFIIVFHANQLKFFLQPIEGFRKNTTSRKKRNRDRQDSYAPAPNTFEHRYKRVWSNSQNICPIELKDSKKPVTSRMIAEDSPLLERQA